MAMVKVEVGVAGFKKYLKEIRNSSRASRELVTLWRNRYNKFLYRRYIRMSGGGWQQLKAKTIKMKRANNTKILREFDDLLQSIQRLTPPRINFSELSVEAGFTNDLGMHPSGRVSFADLATIHQEGLGRVPKREIVVEPPRDVINEWFPTLEKYTEK